MFDNLLDLVKGQAGDAIINNPAIPNEHNDAAVEVASSSIFDTLKNAVAGGNLNDVVSMFSNGSASASTSPIAGLMQNDMVQNLMSKFGINQSQAANVASGLLPNVLQNLVHKTNDPNDSSFNIQGIVSSLTGGSGGFDVGDLLNQFSGNNNQQQNNGGGIMDSLKGLFGN
ncbi:MAG: DUF937 domain-containing protein [Chitinophagaceae bacterium]